MKALLMRILFSSILVSALAACSEYQHTSKGQVEQAQSEQSQLDQLQGELHIQGVDLNTLSVAELSLMAMSVNQLQAIQTNLQNYVKICQDWVRISNLQGVHLPDHDVYAERLQVATDLLTQANQQLTPSH